MTIDPSCTYVVAGLPRSGTSLMMQMLAAGGMTPLTDGVRAPDDDNPKGYYEFEPVKRTRDDAAWLDSAHGKVVKMVHLLLHDLPCDRPYRVILMKRDVREVVASQAAMLARLGRRGGNLSDEALAGAFERQLAEVEAFLDEESSFESLPVSYNELIRAPEAIVESVDAFLGGGLDTARMLAAVEPSLYRQRKP